MRTVLEATTSKEHKTVFYTLEQDLAVLFLEMRRVNGPGSTSFPGEGDLLWQQRQAGLQSPGLGRNHKADAKNC